MTRAISIKKETKDSDSSSIDSSPSPPPKKPSKKNTATKKRKKKKTSKDIAFDDCFRFEATCPYKECPDYSKTIFKSQQTYQQHHALKHERRDRFRNNLVWKCPQCQKICSSFYNFSAHVSMHRNVCKPPWICTLPAAKHSKEYSDKEDHEEDICGKRSSTKNNLISHIRSVHNFNVIGYKERTRTEHYSQNNKKRKRKSSVIRSESDEPKVKRPRMNSADIKSIEPQKAPPSLYPFLLQMCGDKAPNVAQANVLPIFSENVDNKQMNGINIFPGFNSLISSNMNKQYDNITVTSPGTPIAPMPAVNNMNNMPAININQNSNNNNNEAALPTLKQLSNLCQLLQTLKNAEHNNNNNNSNNTNNAAKVESTDMNTVMNCINYMKSCQVQHPPHAHNHNNMKPKCGMHQHTAKCRNHCNNANKNVIQMKQIQGNHSMMRNQANNRNMNTNMNLNMNGMRNRNMKPMNMKMMKMKMNGNNNMKLINMRNCMHKMNVDMNDESNVTLSIQNMIHTLNHMEHVSNINGLGMSNMHKMNGMNSVRNIGNMNRINNITIHNNINNISNGANNNANQAFHSNLPSLNSQY